MENSSLRTGRAEWRFPGVARILRCDRKTLLQPHNRLKPTDMQVDTYLNFQCSGFTESELKFYSCDSIPYHCSTCANSQDSLEINSKTSTLLSHSETDEDGSHFCINSLYYNVHETYNIFKSCNTQDVLTIFHMNVRSLSKNLYKLENLLLAIEHCPDVIAITETTLKNSKSVVSYNLQLEGYDFVHTDTNMNAGGVGFYIKKI